MSTRQTNLALLALTVAAVLTGFVAFSLGTRPGRWAVIAHGVIGLAIVLLSPWKSVIARRGLSRRRSSNLVSITLALTAVITVSSGIVQAGGLASRVGPLTTMQLHVGAGLATLVLAGVHSRQRRVAPRATDLTRRNLIRSGGVLAGALVAYLGAEGLWRATGAPGAERRFTGSHQVVRPDRIPATQWLFDSVQHLAPSHRVMVDGVPLTAEVIASFGDSIETTLDCTSGWYTTQTWSGARLDRLLGGVDGQSILVRSVTGYWRRFPREEAGRLLLATHMANRQLRPGHGAPVRLVAPDRRGFWWVKWVDTVQVETLPPWAQPPLPLR